MAVTVSMPQLGETVTEGTILSWAKQVGDTSAEDEVLQANCFSYCITHRHAPC